MVRAGVRGSVATQEVRAVATATADGWGGRVAARWEAPQALAR